MKIYDSALTIESSMLFSITHKWDDQQNSWLQASDSIRYYFNFQQIANAF